MTTDANTMANSRHGMTVYRILTTCTDGDLADGSSEKSHKGTGRNYYTRRGPTFGVGGGFSKTPLIFKHYQQHFIGFQI